MGGIVPHEGTARVAARLMGSNQRAIWESDSRGGEIRSARARSRAGGVGRAACAGQGGAARRARRRGTPRGATVGGGAQVCGGLGGVERNRGAAAVSLGGRRVFAPSAHRARATSCGRSGARAAGLRT